MNNFEIKNQDQNEEAGASMVEYALLVALIALVAIGGLTFLGGQVDSRFSEIGTSLNAPVN